MRTCHGFCKNEPWKCPNEAMFSISSYWTYGDVCITCLPYALAVLISSLGHVRVRKLGRAD